MQMEILPSVAEQNSAAIQGTIPYVLKQSAKDHCCIENRAKNVLQQRNELSIQDTMYLCEKRKNEGGREGDGEEKTKKDILW